MRNYLIITILFLAGFSSCKDDCKTCPDGYGLVNNECQCMGYINGSKCYKSVNELTNYLPAVGDNLYYSFDNNSSSNFTFNSKPQLVAISPWVASGVNSEFAEIILVEDREAGDIYQSNLSTTVRKPKQDDSASFYPYRNEKGFGLGRTAESITKQINGKTCYLRPYLVQLDTKLFRLHLKWETLEGEVMDTCTKIFTR